MKSALTPAVFDQLFFDARTVNAFTEQKLTDEQLHALYDAAKMPPTAFNAQPARFVFITSQAGKEKLVPLMMQGNQAKTRQAPLTVIVAYDTHFQEHLPEQFPAMDVKGMFDANPELTQTAAFRNGSMQGAYLILAARALGLDCGPMSGFDNAAVDAAFFADGRFKSNFIVNIGYGDASANYPRGPRLSFEQAVTMA
jgi:nitroreductase